MTYEQWQLSEDRELDPLAVVEAPRIWFDRRLKLFVLPDSQRVVELEHAVALLTGIAKWQPMAAPHS